MTIEKVRYTTPAERAAILADYQDSGWHLHTDSKELEVVGYTDPVVETDDQGVSYVVVPAEPIVENHDYLYLGDEPLPPVVSWGGYVRAGATAAEKMRRVMEYLDKQVKEVPL